MLFAKTKHNNGPGETFFPGPLLWFAPGVDISLAVKVCQGPGSKNHLPGETNAG